MPPSSTGSGSIWAAYADALRLHDGRHPPGPDRSGHHRMQASHRRQALQPGDTTSMVIAEPMVFAITGRPAEAVVAMPRWGAGR
ncbi:MAG: hypothetical protein U0Q19_03710 [Kineosporiaceae bacterium]